MTSQGRTIRGVYMTYNHSDKAWTHEATGECIRCLACPVPVAWVHNGLTDADVGLCEPCYRAAMAVYK